MARTCKCGAELLTKSNTCLPCARSYMVQWRKKKIAAGEEPFHVYNYTWRTTNPKSYILQSAKGRAKKRGMEFSITAEDFEIPESCPVLDIKIKIQAGKGTHPNSPSLDRIDSSKGYIKGNVQVLSWRANNLKSDGTADELIKLGEFMSHG